MSKLPNKMAKRLSQIVKDHQDSEPFELTLCSHCNCMTYTVLWKGKIQCGKCGEPKQELEK